MEPDDELARLAATLGEQARGEDLARLIQLARGQGARALLAALDAEGEISPCGQDCGWEGPWAVASTLWPAVRERLLGEDYVPAAQRGAAEEEARLRPSPPNRRP